MIHKLTVTLDVETQGHIADVEADLTRFLEDAEEDPPYRLGTSPGWKVVADSIAFGEPGPAGGSPGATALRHHLEAACAAVGAALALAAPGEPAGPPAQAGAPREGMSSIAREAAQCRGAAEALDRLAAADPGMPVYIGGSIQLPGGLGDVATAAAVLGARFRAADHEPVGAGGRPFTAVEAAVEAGGASVHLYAHIYDPGDRAEAHRLYGAGPDGSGDPETA